MSMRVAGVAQGTAGNHKEESSRGRDGRREEEEEREKEREETCGVESIAKLAKVRPSHGGRGERKRERGRGREREET